MEIRYCRKNVYGNTLFYVVDYVKEIEELTGKKTITPKIIKCLERLGIKCTEVLESQMATSMVKPIRTPW